MFGLALRITLFIGLVVALLFWVMLSFPAWSRDDGRYANSPLKFWFDQLASKKGLCCSFADGTKVEDVDWDVKDGNYLVHVWGEWIKVPDNALVTEPNRFGPPVVWPYREGTFIRIRCFMPGSGS